MTGRAGAPAGRRTADADHLHHQAVDVGERQEGKDARLFPRFGEDLLPARVQGVALGGEIGVGDHAAPGPPGGTRRVRDGGHRPRCHCLAVTVHHGVRDAQALIRQPGHAVRVELPHRMQGRQPVAGRSHGHGMVLVLHHDGRHLGVRQDPTDLVRRGGGVDGHELSADRPQRVAEQRPLVAGPGHHGDPVTEPYALGQQPLRQPHHLVAELGRGHRKPLVAVRFAAPGELFQLRVALGHVVHRIREATPRQGLHQRRKAEIAHGTPSLSHCRAAPPGGQGRKTTGHRLGCLGACGLPRRPWQTAAHAGLVAVGALYSRLPHRTP